MDSSFEDIAACGEQLCDRRCGQLGTSRGRRAVEGLDLDRPIGAGVGTMWDTYTALQPSFVLYLIHLKQSQVVRLL